jgi:quercetin dioxygenase-like cupin family protein
MGFDYPDFIKKLPQADIPINGVRGYLMPSDHGQTVFFDIDPIGEIPEHRHGEQWGFVLSGKMVLKIDGKEYTYTRGDHYHIPAGAAHSAKFLTRFFAVDVFAESGRYEIAE